MLRRPIIRFAAAEPAVLATTKVHRADKKAVYDSFYRDAAYSRLGHIARMRPNKGNQGVTKNVQKALHSVSVHVNSTQKAVEKIHQRAQHRTERLSRRDAAAERSKMAALLEDQLVLQTRILSESGFFGCNDHQVQRHLGGVVGACIRMSRTGWSKSRNYFVGGSGMYKTTRAMDNEFTSLHLNGAMAICSALKAAISSWEMQHHDEVVPEIAAHVPKLRLLLPEAVTSNPLLMDPMGIITSPMLPLGVTMIWMAGHIANLTSFVGAISMCVSTCAQLLLLAAAPSGDEGNLADRARERIRQECRFISTIMIAAIVEQLRARASAMNGCPRLTVASAMGLAANIRQAVDAAAATSESSSPQLNSSRLLAQFSSIDAALLDIVAQRTREPYISNEANMPMVARLRNSKRMNPQWVSSRDEGRQHEKMTFQKWRAHRLEKFAEVLSFKRGVLLLRMLFEAPQTTHETQNNDALRTFNYALQRLMVHFSSGDYVQLSFKECAELIEILESTPRSELFKPAASIFWKPMLSLAKRRVAQLEVRAESPFIVSKLQSLALREDAELCGEWL